MQKAPVSDSPTRPVIRQSYAFNREAVHFATDPIEGGELPKLECRRCGRSLPQDQFGVMAGFKKVGSRVARFKFAHALHPHCFRCRKQQKGKHTRHPLYSPALDAFIAKLVSDSRSRAATRNILFALDKDDVLGLFLEQSGICKLSGLRMDWKTKGYARRNGWTYRAPSIDRINSEGNYVLNNVQLVTQIANVMKNDLPTDMFLGLCRQIADHNLTLS